MSQSGKVLADYPFISQSMTAAAQSTIPSTAQSSMATAQSTLSSTAQSSMAGSMIRNQTVFALGIILIELCMGKPMIELHLLEDKNSDGTKHDLSDFLAAIRLIDMEEISDKFGKRWSEVVRRCIRCDFNQTKTSLEDVAFRQAVYNEVLEQLEEEHRQFFNLA